MPLPGRRRRLPPPPVVAGATDRGPRAENQDRWAAGPGWAVVCDGVGGHAGGAVAAQTALDVVTAHLAGPPPRTEAAAERWLREAAEAANAAVVAGRAAGPATADMATTLTAALLVPSRSRRSLGFLRTGDEIGRVPARSDHRFGEGRGGRTGEGRRRWVVLQVGDSPAWRVAAAGARSITWDHNLVGDLVRTGAIAPEDAIGHRGRNVVTRALGTLPTVEPETFVVTLDPGEDLVLASDGLSDVVGPDAAVAPCAAAPDAAAAAHALVALALARGTMDNVTVVVAR
jgi:serine/threonine protein phosphatase PrpC